MSNESKALSEWARKRTAGKERRAKSIERREAYFDLLVSGYSVEQIATVTKMSPSAVRRAIGQAVAKRQLDAPENFARLQVARLTKALRCADNSLEMGDLKAIAPFVKVVTELNRFHGLAIGALRLTPSMSVAQIAPETTPRLALTHSIEMAEAELFMDAKYSATSEAIPTTAGANSTAK